MFRQKINNNWRVTMKKFYVLISVFILLISINGCGNNSGQKDLPMAFVEKIENGSALLKKASAKDFTPLKVKENLSAGDTIKTADKTEVLLRFSTGAVTRILPNSKFQLKERKLAKTGQATVYTRLLQGIAYFYVPKGNNGAKKFEVETNRAIASIKGTKFKVEATEAKTTLSVGEGLVEFMDKQSKKSVDVGKLKSADVTENGVSEVYAGNSMNDPYFSDIKFKIMSKTGQ